MASKFTERIRRLYSIPNQLCFLKEDANQRRKFKINVSKLSPDPNCTFKPNLHMSHRKLQSKQFIYEKKDLGYGTNQHNKSNVNNRIKEIIETPVKRKRRLKYYLLKRQKKQEVKKTIKEKNNFTKHHAELSDIKKYNLYKKMIRAFIDEPSENL